MLNFLNVLTRCDRSQATSAVGIFKHGLRNARSSLQQMLQKSACREDAQMTLVGEALHHHAFEVIRQQRDRRGT